MCIYLSSRREKLHDIPLSDSPVRCWSRENEFSNSFIRNASNSRGTQFLTNNSFTQSIAREPRLPELSVESPPLSQPRLAKWKMVSRMLGVIRLERDIQLNKCARQRRARLQISSVCESSGTKGAFLAMVGVVLGGVSPREVVGVTWGGVKVREGVGVARRCGDCARRPCKAEVGVPKGDDAVCCDEVGVCEALPVTSCLIGDTLGEGGGVGVTE